MRRLVVVMGIASTTVAVGAQTPAGPSPVEPPFSFVESSVREARPGRQGAIEEFYLKLRAAEAKVSARGLTDNYVLDEGGAGQLYYSFRTLRSGADLDTRLAQVAADTMTTAYGTEEYQRLATALQEATASTTTEVLRVLPGRSTWREAVQSGIAASHHVLVALSSDWAASPACRYELAIALERRKPIIAVDLPWNGGAGDTRALLPSGAELQVGILHVVVRAPVALPDDLVARELVNVTLHRITLGPWQADGSVKRANAKVGAEVCGW